MRLLKTICIGLIVLASFASVSAQRHVLPVCPKLADAEKLVGFDIKLIVPKDTVVHKGRDIDYEVWSIGFGPEKQRSYLTAMFGLNVGNGEPIREVVRDSSGVTRHYWTLRKERGVDSTGILKNGRRWRHFGMFGEVIWYLDVPVEAAQYFDRILATACFVEQPEPQKGT